MLLCVLLYYTPQNVTQHLVGVYVFYRDKPIGASPRRDYLVTRMVLVRIE